MEQNCAKTCINFPKKCGLCKNLGCSNLDFYEEEKQRDNVATNRNYKVGIRAERAIVSKYGGKRVVGSGSLSGLFKSLSGDVVMPEEGILVQCKTQVKKTPLESFIVRKNWLDKHIEQAEFRKLKPVLMFSFAGTQKWWCISLIDEVPDDAKWVAANKKSVVLFRQQLELNAPMYFSFKNDNNVYIIEPASNVFKRDDER